MGFALKKDDQKIARALLNDYDPVGSNKEFEHKYQHALENISYKVYRSPDYSKIRGTFLFMAHQSQPYSFMVDEFVVQMYFHAKHKKNNNQLFFGFEKITDAAFNDYHQGEFIQGLTYDDFGNRMDNFVEFYKALRLRVYDNLLNKLHYKLGFRGTMDKGIKDEILQQVASDTTKLGRKYTKEDFIKCTTTVLMKYGLRP
ncbi:hypothetical protein [Pedobacter frigoris]|uniref:Uncharacterized protein n=1 Tax=Pedobacter frigoris TaxID=2571272 RepID=A0A4U1CDG5_9SPHI|nr:hypothetical protein [Pedobacter frigoris]TKC04244.1 hypothetical protein FA047_16745 [Pedobacter frigoris]